MDKKLQRSILEYIKQSKGVTRGQVINVLCDQDIEKRSAIQENINLLLDSGLIHIVGLADELALTNNGHVELNLWYKKINWKKVIIYLLSASVSILSYLAYLFSGEVKKIITDFMNK